MHRAARHRLSWRAACACTRCASGCGAWSPARGCGATGWRCASRPPGGLAYALLTGTFGYADTWIQANGSAPGFTSGFNELVNDANTSGLDTRIDHVLTRGAAEPSDKSLVTGTDPANRTPAGLWPSDHAGVVTRVFP